uniref:GATA-type domain-containing protein n=1 Tax=Kalanchoe fedtschenkoi TaxID=63787 RepID=A0A7N0T2G4_KALFE
MFDQMEKGSEKVELKSNNGFTITAAAVGSDVSYSSGSEGQAIKKTCSDCGTSKTPLWRGGPAGPKSLCNACGIRSRKRRRALLGLSKPEEKRSKKSASSSSNNGSISSESGGDGEKKLTSHLKLTGLTWQRSTADKYRRKLGEEEQAAVLLMAMAYSSVLA